MAPSHGARLGAYEILATLGAGGMGAVYRARDHTLARGVALKVLSPRWLAEPERIERFEREARAIAALNHPNIAAIGALEQFDAPASAGLQGVRALVLALVEGETLAHRSCVEGRLDVVPALRIARQLADAPDAAREKGIIHRDLKPASIAVTPDDVVKVLDFGLAKLVPRPDTEDASDLAPIEGTGVGSSSARPPT